MYESPNITSAHLLTNHSARPIDITCQSFSGWPLKSKG